METVRRRIVRPRWPRDYERDKAGAGGGGWGVGVGARLRRGFFVRQSARRAAPSPTPHTPTPQPPAFFLRSPASLSSKSSSPFHLLGLLMLGMLFAMRIGLTTFAKTDSKLMINRRVVGAQRVLDEELEGLMPETLASCGETLTPSSGLPLFQGEAQAMRLVSTFSLQQAWRGQPQILELFVIQADDGPRRAPGGERNTVFAHHRREGLPGGRAGPCLRGAGGPFCAARGIRRIRSCWRTGWLTAASLTW